VYGRLEKLGKGVTSPQNPMQPSFSYASLSNSQPISELRLWKVVFPVFGFHETHLQLYSVIKRSRKKFNVLKYCGRRAVYPFPLRNHPKATRSKNATYMEDLPHTWVWEGAENGHPRRHSSEKTSTVPPLQGEALPLGALTRSYMCTSGPWNQ
jgi:hypothetical protein